MNLKMTRWERQKINAQHPWRVGELCQAFYDNIGEGYIYRVLKVTAVGNSPILKIEPIFGVLAGAKSRKNRDLGAGYCTPLTLIDLATEYSRFGLFIAQEAKRNGAEPETVAEDISPRQPDHVEGREEDVSASGLCADFSARNEVRNPPR